MTVPSHFPRIRLLLCAVALAFCSSLAVARNTTTPTAIVESKLGGETILSAPAAKLVATVEDCVREYPLRAARIVQAVLIGGRADADAIAPQVTASAISALGKDPSAVTVHDIVYYAVKATPAVVLEIVKASVKASPSSAKVIVRAAVQAVPNPTDKIQPIEGGNANAPDTGYAKDEKDQPEADTSQDPLPIGEAIARAAQAGDPSLSLQDLMNTVTQAQDPGTSTPGTYKGYYYPPLLTGGPSPTPTPAAMPSPPVVSP